jgi:predicted aldo/keto reductase-like oxidoreductase
MNKLSRRSFLKASLASASGLVVSPKEILSENVKCATVPANYDAKGLPTVVLGKTEVVVPRMAFGLGSRFCTIKSEEESTELLEQALAGGLYYWDTASIYADADGKIISEERVGHAVKNHRNQIFLSTKVTSRDPNEAMRSIELSLRRLQTDHLDILKIHDVHSHEDNQKILQKGGLVDILHRMKEEKVTRFIGFSGHAEPSALTELIDKSDFDCMLFAMNHWPGGLNTTASRHEQVITKALEKNMGIMLMKVIRPLDTVEGVNAEDLIRYALSLKGAHGITVGIDNLKTLQSNLKILKEFVPMEEQEKQKITTALTPFFQGRNLPWMDANYCDGYWT